MFDFNNWDFDLDGDGVPDLFVSDTDGDGIPDTYGMDSNGDGIVDTWHSELDADGDGRIDTIIDGYDYNQDGAIDSQTIYYDNDQNGVYEEVIKAYDANEDGYMDDFTTYRDLDEDGSEDEIVKEQYLDQDEDGIIDTYVMNADLDGDHAFETVKVYNIDMETDEIEISPISIENVNIASGLYADDLDNFDPSTADMDVVSGNPGESMEQWEYQGGTGRCALYSQKFVIEELTHQDIDIEEMADLAERNGWFSEEGGTPLLNMNKVLDYFGIDNEMSFHNDMSDLKRELEAGKKIIVSIDADEIWYGEEDDLFTPGDGPNHAVEVIGIDYTDQDNPMVILNDSGNPDGCGEMVPFDTFMDAWEDGNCQMISCI